MYDCTRVKRLIHSHSGRVTRRYYVLLLITRARTVETLTAIFSDTYIHCDCTVYYCSPPPGPWHCTTSSGYNTWVRDDCFVIAHQLTNYFNYFSQTFLVDLKFWVFHFIFLMALYSSTNISREENPLYSISRFQRLSFYNITSGGERPVCFERRASYYMHVYRAIRISRSRNDKRTIDKIMLREFFWNWTI